MKTEAGCSNAARLIAILVVFACLVPNLAWGVLPINEPLGGYENVALPRPALKSAINQFPNITDPSEHGAILFAEANLETLVNQWSGLSLHQKADVFSEVCSRFLKDRVDITNQVNHELNRSGNRLSDHRSSYESFKRKADNTLRRLFERWEQNRDPNLLNRMLKINEKLKAMKDALDVIDRWDFQTQIELEELYHPSLGRKCAQICNDFDATVKDFTSYRIPDHLQDQIMELLNEGKDCFDYKSSWGRVGGLRERLRNRRETIKENFSPALYAGNDLLKKAEKVLSEVKTEIEMVITGPSQIEAEQEFELSVKPRDPRTALGVLIV